MRKLTALAIKSIKEVGFHCDDAATELSASAQI